jgi:transcriptional regulator with XRE-family HTH domain
MPRARTAKAETARRNRRVCDLLAELEKVGLTQREVAERAGVPSQYLSDVKAGRRGLTELFARRLAQEFGVDHRWLMTGEGSLTPPCVGQPTHGRLPSTAAHVPVLSEPVIGDPRTSPSWDGSWLELVGPAAVAAQSGRDSYILRLARGDDSGRMRANDMVLVLQDETPAASVAFVQHSTGPLLARRAANGIWRGLDSGAAFGNAPAIVGYCVGLVWAPL